MVKKKRELDYVSGSSWKRDQPALEPPPWPACGGAVLVAVDCVGFEIHCANCYTGEVSLAAWGRTRESAIADWQENIDIYQDNRSARG